PPPSGTASPHWDNSRLFRTIMFKNYLSEWASPMVSYSSQTCRGSAWLARYNGPIKLDTKSGTFKLQFDDEDDECQRRNDVPQNRRSNVGSPARSSPFLSVKGPALMHWLTGPLAETSADRRPAGRLRRLASSHELWPAGVVHAPRSGLLA